MRERPELARGADGPIIEGFVLAELIRQSSYAPGVVLHTGPRGGKLSDRLFSLPISELWR